MKTKEFSAKAEGNKKMEVIMKKPFLLILVLIMLLSLVACNNTSDTSNTPPAGAGQNAPTNDSPANETGSEDPFWFAYCSSQTVENADYGVEQLAALRIAVDELNAAGGINGREVKFDVFDDQGSAQEALTCAQKIVSDGKYQFVIGYNSSGRFMAANPTFEAAGIPVIQTSTTAAKVTEQGFKNNVRVCARDDIAIGAVIEAMVEDMGGKKAVCIVDNAEGEVSQFEGSKPYFEQYGVEIVDAQIVEVSERDYSAIITNWKKMDFDTVFFAQNYDHLAVFLNQAVQLGLIKDDTRLVCVNGSVNTAAFTDLVKNNADGMIVSACYTADTKSEAWKHFNEAYTAETGTKAGEAAITTYAGFELAVQAYNNYGATSETLIDILKNNDFNTIMGVATFDDKGDNSGCLGGVCKITDMVIEIYDWKNK